MERLLPFAARAGDLLKRRNATLSVAESSAGGLISASLLAVPGASAYFLGGGVVYTRVSREAMLAMPREEIIPSSEESALFLARAARTRLGADWGLAETGAAGPTGPAGRSFIAVSGPIEVSRRLETGIQDRWENMLLFSEETLTLLADTLDALG